MSLDDNSLDPSLDNEYDNDNNNNDDEFEDTIDVIEFIQSKGLMLDAFKYEYLDTQKNLDNIITNNICKERELDQLCLELKMLRDQHAFVRRNIDELISQQEVLKETIDNAHIKKENFLNYEKLHKEEINQYTINLELIKQTLSGGSSLSYSQLEMITNLEKEKEYITTKYDNKLNLLEALRNDYNNTINEYNNIDNELKNIEKLIDKIDYQHKYDIKKLIINMLNNKDNIEKKVFITRSNYLLNEELLNESIKNINKEEKNIKELIQLNIKSIQLKEKNEDEYIKLERNLDIMRIDVDKIKNYNIKLQEEILERELNINDINNNINYIKNEIKKKNILKNLIIKQLEDKENEKIYYENKILDLNNNINQLKNNNINIIRKEIDIIEKSISKLKQDLDITRKKNTNIEINNKLINDIIILNNNSKINLILELKLINDNTKHIINNINTLLIEKEKFDHDNEIAYQNYYHNLEELKLQEIQINELNKKIIHDQLKLKMKMSLYESLRSDRNVLCKQLHEVQQEMIQMKRKFKLMNHDIDVMKEDISLKDNLLVKEHFLHHSVDKEREMLKNEIIKMKKQLIISQNIMNQQKNEMIRLLKLVEEAENEKLRQKNEVLMITNEKHKLISELVNRNTEMKNINDSLHHERSSMHSGYLKYKEILELQDKLSNDIIKIVKEHNNTIIKLKDYHLLEHNILQNEKELRNLQIKNRSLQDELLIPLNVHRWRKLQSSDPLIYHHLQQLHTQQNELLNVQDKLDQTKLLINEKEKIYIELKKILSRHPGPEVHEQVKHYTLTLKNKNNMYKKMKNELDMYIHLTKSLQHEIVKINDEIQGYNKEWVDKQYKLYLQNHKTSSSSNHYNNNNSNQYNNDINEPDYESSTMNLSGTFNGINLPINNTTNNNHNDNINQKYVLDPNYN